MTQEEIVDLIKHTIKRLMEIHLARSNNGQPVDHIFARVDELGLLLFEITGGKNK